MTYDDMFRKAMEEGKFLYAAELAIGFGEGKASRAGAWSWADDAVKAASMAGVRLDPGRGSRPDFERMLSQLRKCRGVR